MTCRRLGIRLTRDLLIVHVRRQQMTWLTLARPALACGPVGTDDSEPIVRQIYRVSTSRFGIGERINSNCTPRGLHRIARKAGGGWPVGAVFESRRFVGFTWDGRPGAAITNRILWLEGMEPGKNQGGEVDTFVRFVYIHGTGDETSLGRPASRGCIHLSGADLLPLYDTIPVNTLVWIDADSA